LALWKWANAELSDLLVVRLLPQAGLAILPELWRALCRERRQAGLRLLLICRGNPAVGLELCRLALAGDDLMLRESAVSAIGQVPDRARAIISALARSLRETAGPDRAAYARALGKIGPAARDAVPALCEALQDESHYVRIAAAEALGHIRSPAALPALRAVAANDPTQGVRFAAVCAIGRLGMPWGNPHR
jgi:HEAT repeat protein